MVVKEHGAHPGTSEIIAEAIHAAILACVVHPGVFSLIQGGSRQVGEALVTYPPDQGGGLYRQLGRRTRAV